MKSNKKESKLAKKKRVRNNAILAIPIICVLYSIIYIFDKSKEGINSFINNSHVTTGKVLKKSDYSSSSRYGSSTTYHMNIKYYNKFMRKDYIKEITATKNEYNTYKINDALEICILEEQNEIMSKAMLKRYKEGISMNTTALIINIILYSCIAFFALIGSISFYIYLNFEKIIKDQSVG